MSSFFLGLVLLVGLALLSPASKALESPWVNSGEADVRVLSPAEGVVSKGSLLVGVEIRLPEGWHTYWRNPGDSGEAVSLSWRAEGLTSASQITWPIPERIPYGPLINLGYKDSVLLTQVLSFGDLKDAEVIDLTLSGRWLVCSDVCIPEEASFQISVPVVGIAGNDPELTTRFQNLALPQSLPLLTTATWDEPSILQITMGLPGLDQDRINGLYFLPFESDLVDLTEAPRTQFGPEGFSVWTRFGSEPATDYSGLLWYEERVGGALIRSAVIIDVPVPKSQGSTLTVLTAMLAALLGGLLLNLMPCVFPVLSIKVMSLIKESSSSRTRQRLQGWWYTLGVVISFLLVASVLIGLRYFGEELGWGFQLQSPMIVAGLSLIFLVLGFNLSGFFELTGGISVPGVSDSGALGAFLNGVLAVVVAAPCTAPFMGAALGFALVQPPYVALLIFASLGFGMALPLLLLTYIPALMSRLPKPGPWMESFRQGAAFLMYATVIWLFWILIRQAGPDGFVFAAVAGLLLTVLIWIWVRFDANRWLNRLILLVLGFCSLASLSAIEPINQSVAGGSIKNRNVSQAPTQSIAYSTAALNAARARGPVFVNFTADWCITCKVNEAVAIATPETEALFESNDITYMKADWTREDPDITQALAQFDRVGVPLYLAYREGFDEPLILPQVLTPGMILRAFSSPGD